MCDPYLPISSKWLKPLLLGAAVGLVIVVVALLIFVFGQFRRYQDTAPVVLDIQVGEVFIVGPDGIRHANQGKPMVISVQAAGNVPFTSMELWVDGVLAGVDGAPSEGITPLRSEFTWIPNQSGVHQIIARARDSQRGQATSKAVLVIVQPDNALLEQSTEGGAADASGGTPDDSGVSPVVFPAAPGGAPQAPMPPGANDPVSDGQPWQGSPGDWVNSLTTDSAPNQPGIIGQEYGCGANIYIQDLSDNEEGFRIFRQALNTPTWTQAAVLASQDQYDWIKFIDEGVSGPLSYYVTAFNSQGEISSDLVTVFVPDTLAGPDDPCDQGDGTNKLPLLTVELANLIPKTDSDKSYCYQSIGGLQWKRIPQSGFFTAGEKITDISRLLLTDPQGQPLFESIDLYLECWGWSSSELQFLGKHVQKIDLSNPADVLIDMGNFSAEVLVGFSNLGDLLKPGEIFTLEGENGPNFLKIDPELARKLTNSLTFDSTQMPFISAWISYDPDQCTAHLEPEAQNLFGSLTLCQPYPGYNIGPGGVNPQPYLVWSMLDNTCSAGFNEQCLPHQFWVEYAQNHGYDFHWILEVKSNSANFPTYSVYSSKPFRSSWLPHDGLPGCDEGNLAMRVSMGLFSKNGGDNLVGPTSNWVAVKCGSPIEDLVFIEVTFKNLSLSNVDDGDTHVGEGCIGECPDTLEVYGRFGARQASWNAVAGRIVIGHEPLSSNNCGNPDDVDLSVEVDDLARPGTCLAFLTNGSYNLVTMPTCAAGPDEVSKFASSQDNNYCPYIISTHNNTLLLSVKDGDSIKLAADLIDHDISSNDDAVCVVSLWTQSKPLIQWAATSDESYFLSANHDNADCSVEVVLNAVVP